MRIVIATGMLAPLVVLMQSVEVKAQGMCYAPATGTVQACGTAAGYFRPQPYTLNRHFIPMRTPPGSYYAPIGPTGANWQQFSVRNGYGRVEPNPYSRGGLLGGPRTINHLYQTRIRGRY